MKNDGHADRETQRLAAVAADAAIVRTEPKSSTQRRHSPSDDTILAICGLWRQRQAWHRAEKSLTLAAGAPCRRLSDGDKVAGRELFERIESGETRPGDEDAIVIISPILAARAQIRPRREAVEKQLATLAKLLPVWSWAESIPRFSALGLASLVGECGDIGSYKTISALWKRMGVAVINGERQRCKEGVAALEHGYSPQRHSVLWNVSTSLIGASVGGGPRPYVGEDINAREDWSEWQKLFVARMRVEVTHVTSTWNGEEHRREPSEDPKNGKLRESFSKHCANRAKRYVAKKFLAKLRVAWRGEQWDDLKFGDGHDALETQVNDAVAADAARGRSKPRVLTQRRSSSRDGQSSSGTQRRAAVAADAATRHPKPLHDAQRRHPS